MNEIIADPQDGGQSILDQQIRDLIRALINSPAEIIITTLDTEIPAGTLNGHWQGHTILMAAHSAAGTHKGTGRARQHVTAMDVHAALMATGKLANQSLADYWQQIISPTDPLQVVEHHRDTLPILCRRIRESAYRQRIHDQAVQLAEVAFTADITFVSGLAHQIHGMPATEGLAVIRPALHSVPNQQAAQ